MTARLVWVLLRNELRLTWRAYSSARRWTLLVMVCVMTAIAHVAAFGVVRVLAASEREAPIEFEQKAWLMLAAFLLGSGVVGAAHAIVDRHDADLLLTAPIPPSLVVLTRWAVIAAGSSLATALFGLPLIDAAAIFLHRGYLGGYVVLVALVAAGATFGLTVALTLLRWFGPRKGRIVTQLVGAFLGVALIFGMQSAGLLLREAPALFHVLSRLANNPVTSVLARAGRGDPAALALTVAVVAAATAVVLRAFGESLLRGYAEPETASRSPKGPLRVVDTRLGPAVARKDLRLVLRDPLLLAKILPQTLILVPLVIGMSRGFATVGLAGGAVLVAVQLAYVLAAVIASGEEGWDLIRASPASERTVLLAKLGAACTLPALAAVLLLAPVALALGPLPALYAAALAAIGGFAAAWLEVAHVRPTPRRDIFRKQRPGDIERGIWLIFVGGLGAASAVFAALGMWTVSLVVLVPYVAACAATVLRRRVLELPE